MTDPTDDLGLTTGFQTPANLIWGDEAELAGAERERLRAAWNDLRERHMHEALGRLLAVPDDAYAASPSFATRRFYYLGLAYQLLAESDEPDTATQSTAGSLRMATLYYHRALDIAINCPLPIAAAAQVVMCWRIAECERDLLRYEAALSWYRTAHSTLQRFTPGDELAVARAGIRIYNFLAREHMTAGQYQHALDNLDLAAKTRARHRSLLTTRWDHATAAWLRALILRAQSQQSGGDLSMLRDSRRIFRQIERWLLGEPAHRDSLRRLFIQLAETYLDLAEYFRDRRQPTGFKVNLKRGALYATKAIESLSRVKDPHSQLMAQLALARRDHLSLRDPEQPARRAHPRQRKRTSDGDSMMLAERIVERVAEVERGARALRDKLLLARVETLRADMLRAAGDLDMALATYRIALDLFEAAAARGESTRATYGRSRTLQLLAAQAGYSPPPGDGV